MYTPIYDKLWYHLKISNATAFKKDFKFPDHHEKGLNGWALPHTEVFDPEWLEQMSFMRFLKNCSVFYRPANHNNNGCHVDINNANLENLIQTGFNFVFGGSGSEQVWYEPPAPYTVDNLEYGVNNSGNKSLPYLSYDATTLKEIDSVNIIEGRMTMVRIDLPHQIRQSSEPRWAFSLRCNPELTWDILVNMMRERDLLIER